MMCSAHWLSPVCRYETIGTGSGIASRAFIPVGLSVGGEYGTSATYMSEVAAEGRKGFTHHFSM